jgi:hypothetical protein
VCAATGGAARVARSGHAKPEVVGGCALFFFFFFFLARAAQNFWILFRTFPGLQRRETAGGSAATPTVPQLQPWRSRCVQACTSCKLSGLWLQQDRCKSSLQRLGRAELRALQGAEAWLLELAAPWKCKPGQAGALQLLGRGARHPPPPWGPLAPFPHPSW